MSLFQDRRHGGRRLADELANRSIPDDAIVLGLARGGVPVAFEVARRLGLELDAFIVRKLGAPAQPELAIGAIASGDARILNEHIVRILGLTEQVIEGIAKQETAELHRRERAYRGERKPPRLTGRTVILVDDGLATGASMQVAIEAVRKQNPRAIICATPVAPPQTRGALLNYADEVICLETPEPFFGVGAWYHIFDQTSDEEVRELLQRAGQHARGGSREEPNDDVSLPIDDNGRFLRIETDDATLEGNLQIPANARGLVLFAHGSGSSRFSPRNRYVAGTLNERGFATLLIDLLTEEEEIIDQRTRRLRFDIDLLAKRLIGTLDWLTTTPETDHFKLGLFGASTGAAAALIAAARRPESVRAVVSRGGRPDLAGEALARVQAPTLCLVGSRDLPVITLNERALDHIAARQKQMSLIPGATHLFSEPGALESVAEQAGQWFGRFLFDLDQPYEQRL